MTFDCASSYIVDHYGEFLVASMIIGDLTSVFWYVYGLVGMVTAPSPLSLPRTTTTPSPAHAAFIAPTSALATATTAAAVAAPASAAPAAPPATHDDSAAEGGDRQTHQQTHSSSMLYDFFMGTVS